MNISVIGGDLRIVRLIQMYAKEKNKIYTYSLEKILEENNNIIKCKTLDESLTSSQIILSGMPFSKDGKFVNSPFSDYKINIKELKNKLVGRKFIAGGIPKEYYNENIENIDLLENEQLTILNAVATVEGTIKIVIEKREETIFESNVLICGFGRIGKILCNRFKVLGANVYCTARKQSDLTWIRENRYIPIRYDELCCYANKFDIVINTVPTTIINEKELKSFNKNVLIVDLASKPGGIDINIAEKIGIKVIVALGIPGKEMPTSAAKYIKEVVDTVIF